MEFIQRKSGSKQESISVFRAETLVGIEINKTKNWNISAEFGLTTQAIPLRQRAVDRFYFQYKPGEDYQLVQTKTFDFRYPNYALGRVHICYKFGGIRL